MEVRSNSPVHYPLTQKEIEYVAQEVTKKLMPVLRVYQQEMKVLNEQMANADRNIAEADRSIALAQAKRAQAEQKLQGVDKKRQDILTRQFYSIFVFNGKKPLTPETTNQLFATYLAKQNPNAEEKSDLTTEESADGKVCYGQINSMRPVIRYLGNHPNVNACNFQTFKSKVYDVLTFANYVANPACPIIAVALNKDVYNANKEIVDQAVAARKGKLQLQLTA